MKGRRAKRDKRDAEIIALRLRISELLLSGFTERAIAQAVHKSPATTHYHIQFLLRQWREATARNVGKWVGRALAEYDLIARESWEAWEKSKAPQRTETLRARGVGRRTRRERPVKVDGATLVEVSQKVTVTTSAGDPNFLFALCRVIEQRTKLLGLTVEEPPAEAAPEVGDYEKARARLLEALGRRP
jgi:hypothetical protein